MGDPYTTFNIMQLFAEFKKYNATFTDILQFIIYNRVIYG